MLFRKNRTKGKGGGVALYVNGEVDCKEIRSDGMDESVWVKITLGEEK